MTRLFFIDARLIGAHQRFHAHTIFHIDATAEAF